MKESIAIAIILCAALSFQAQQIGLVGGKTNSTFDYTNSSGTSLANIQSTDHNFMKLMYRKNIYTPNLFVNVQGAYNAYGAKGSDIALDNYFEWNLSYLGLDVGLDYEVYKPNNFTIYLKGSVSTEFMIQGTQTINDQVYNLTNEEDFDTPFYFLRPGLGLRYAITESLTAFTQYEYGSGNTFKDIQGDLKINTHNVGFGLLFNLSKFKLDSLGIENQLSELRNQLSAQGQKISALENSVGRVDSLEQELGQKEKIIEEKEEEINQREDIIAAKEQEIEELKRSISQALVPYKEQGMSVHERNGKIYITMENDMLFKPGSWEIGSEGEKAVNDLGRVLAENPDVTVLIEGHTDNTPFQGKGNVTNNWDLSTKRATTIVELLRKNEYINPKNLTAAGRGEYDPIADNNTEEGRAANRRIEVIITPKLGDILKIIED